MKKIPQNRYGESWILLLILLSEKLRITRTITLFSSGPRYHPGGKKNNTDRARCEAGPVGIYLSIECLFPFRPNGAIVVVVKLRPIGYLSKHFFRLVQIIGKFAVIIDLFISVPTLKELLVDGVAIEA